MKIVLICHDGALLTQQGMAHWLNSFSDLVGIVVIKEKQKRFQKRVYSEIKRVGVLRFLDVLFFRIYYKLILSKKDKFWENNRLEELLVRYSEPLNSVPILYTSSPNSDESLAFIKQVNPDITIARCKTLLKSEIYSIASRGTYVMHPGICPEYRNAHGCFWALAKQDMEKVGMTLLKINDGIDTGPVKGYYTCDFNEIEDSHIVIQHKVVFDNLDKLEMKLKDIYENNAENIDTKGRDSNLWGQPWLTSYIKWKYHAKNKK